MAIIITTFIYFVIIPVYKIFTLPVNPGPVLSKSKEEALIATRIKKFKKNKFLNDKQINIDVAKDSREKYIQTIQFFEKECTNIRKKYVAQLFYSSSISQNGFIDAMLVLSYSVNMVKDIFVLYNGRVTNRDLLKIDIYINSHNS